mmetsp:Transcript_13024/g.19647  ORF Transcript_13024/g.19647 Transcript_13024/m.19647 type:complete len:252 (+) Transcript_13024:83-838(+)
MHSIGTKHLHRIRCHSHSSLLARRYMSASSTDDEDGRGAHKHINEDLVPIMDRLHASIFQIRNIRGNNYVQLATVSEDGLPTCRTVVFRGFLHHDTSLFGASSSMQFITDSRSNKVAHLKHHPAGEVVWWMPSISEQFRISGSLTAISAQHSDKSMVAARLDIWHTLSAQAKQQFFWNDPGRPYLEPPVAVSSTDCAMVPPPENFLLLLLLPHRLHFLRLKDNYAQQDERRTLSDIQSSSGHRWQCCRVNP